jgi:hypothetical protein
MTLVLITSVINISTNPLSYIKTRSVYTREQRFEDTKKTIASIRDKIPGAIVFFVECSQLSAEEREYLEQHVDLFLNLFDTKDEGLLARVSSPSKSMGEGTMMICALQYLFENNVPFDHLFKISGRYWLNDSFQPDRYANDKTVVHYIHGDSGNVFTCFYKLTRIHALCWLEYLRQSEELFIRCIGFEVMFGYFLKERNEEDILVNKDRVGINGYVSVANEFIDM